MNCELGSLYLCVRDMDRAVRFYEDFFERRVTERDEIYSIFVIGGFRLGLFAFERVWEEHSFGSNCLPSVSVDSVETLRRKVKGLRLCFPLTRIKENWVAEFVDSEGNHVEVTAPIREGGGEE